MERKKEWEERNDLSKSKQIRRLDFLDQQLVRAQRREKRDKGQGAERGGLMIQGDGESM